MKNKLNDPKKLKTTTSPTNITEEVVSASTSEGSDLSSRTLQSNTSTDSQAFPKIVDFIRKYDSFSNVEPERHIPAESVNYYQPNPGDKKAVDFLFKLLNETRRLDERAPYKFVDIDSMSPEHKSSLGGQSIHMPAYAERIFGGDIKPELLVDDATNAAVETKNGMAQASAFFRNGSRESRKYIDSYLSERGVAPGDIPKKAAKIRAAFVRHNTPTGVVHNPEDLNDIARGQGKEGVVFKIDRAAAGAGVVIVRPEDMQTPGFNAFDFISKKLAAPGKQNKTPEEIASLISREDITWQSLVPTGEKSLEGSIQFRVNPEADRKAGDRITSAYATSYQFCDPDGTHRGNVAKPLTELDRFVPKPGARDAFLWSQEIMIDKMLKDKGYKKGLVDPNAVLKLYGIDILFKDGDIAKPLVCEVNGRPSFVTRVILKDDKSDIRQKEVLGLDSRKQLVSAKSLKLMQQAGAENVARIVHDHAIKPNLGKAEGAVFDSFQVKVAADPDPDNDKYRNGNSKRVATLVPVSVFRKFEPNRANEYVNIANNFGKDLSHVLRPSSLRPKIDLPNSAATQNVKNTLRNQGAPAIQHLLEGRKAGTDINARAMAEKSTAVAEAAATAAAARKEKVKALRSNKSGNMQHDAGKNVAALAAAAARIKKIGLV